MPWRSCRLALLVFGKIRQPGHDPRYESARGRGFVFGVGTALVEVADEQVGAAAIAELADLCQQSGHGQIRFSGPPVTQVITPVWSRSAVAGSVARRLRRARGA